MLLGEESRLEGRLALMKILVVVEKLRKGKVTGNFQELLNIKDLFQQFK
jgi:hypothetical protein